MFQRHDEFVISCLLFEDLDRHLDSLCRFGGDHRVLARLACTCRKAGASNMEGGGHGHPHDSDASL